jgi:para-aminobenzoate synthetase
LSGIRTLIVDNYDSFTFNLYQLIGQVNGEEPVVVRNDQCAWADIAAMAFDNVVISPGPGTPEREEDFGICRDAILKAEVPVLGVCLGHQGLGLCFGGEICHAPEPVHGRTSVIRHDGSRLFAGVPQDFQVVRYHSLMVGPNLPDCLRRTAWTADGIVMGLAHRELPRFGIQFHPESICSEYGDLILKNFRDITPRGTRVAFAAKVSQRTVRQKTIVPHPPANRRAPLPWRVHSRRIPFDASRTPQVFSALYGNEPYAFWLDSSRPEPGMARFSFMGGMGGPLSAFATYDHRASEITVVRSGHRQTLRENIYDYLTEELSRRRCDSEELPFDFNCGFAGYFGYELKADAGASDKHRPEQPDAAFLFADRMIAFDHEESEAWLVSYGAPEDAGKWMDDTARILADLPPEPDAEPPAAPACLTLRMERNREEYLADIERCRQYIRDGESYEICLTNQVHANAIRDPLAFYRKLRSINPAPYAAFLRFGELAILSSSPERFLRIDRNGVVESKPIKGTRPRGETPEQDEALRRDLAENEKDRSENLMIVDLLRNDIGLVSEMGSVKVKKLMNVETYETVHQLVSTIRGWVRPGIGAAGCVRAAFPGGSMTGAPKLRTMNIIDELEPGPRGIYSGAIGFLSLCGAADLNVVIRTLVSTPAETTFGVGGAIVALSKPEDEFEETLVKARALVQALILDARGTAEKAAVEQALAELRASGETILQWR